MTVTVSIGHSLSFERSASIHQGFDYHADLSRLNTDWSQRNAWGTKPRWDATIWTNSREDGYGIVDHSPKFRLKRSAIRWVKWWAGLSDEERQERFAKRKAEWDRVYEMVKGDY